MKTKDTILVIMAICLAIFAVHKQLQFVAVFCFGAAGAVFYRFHTIRVIEDLRRLAASATNAKFGRVEINLGEHGIHSVFKNLPEKDQALIHGMAPHDLGILMTIYHAKEYSPAEGLKRNLRQLRDRGLVEHNADSLTGSDRFWLSEAGHRLMVAITSAGTASNQTDR